MNANSLNVSKIESFMVSILEGNVGEAVYVGNPPSTIATSMNSFSVIDVNNVEDLDAFGRATVLVYLYGRPNANSTKKAALISAMATKMNELIENNTSNNYQLERRSTYSDYDSTRNWFYDVVEVIVKIL